MKLPDEQDATGRILAMLGEWLGSDEVKTGVRQPEGELLPDATVGIAGRTFVIEWKRAGSLAAVAGAVEHLKRYPRSERSGTIALVAVPYMGEAGKRHCEAAGVSWLDLSGNARIVAPGLQVHVEGRPNAYAHRGRPANVFAPKSSRAARWMLMHPESATSQRDLARAVDIDEGQLSRVVSRLVEDGLVLRDEGGLLRAPEPDLLLQAWNEAYDFSRHEIIRGHVAARSGDALARQLAEAFEARSIEYAATGLAAAWIYTRFVGFRTATLYVRERPDADVLKALGFREDERGANLWLVLPNDEGVFHGAATAEGVHCVHPVQAWLDLHGHPERATEAAERLRDDYLKWSSDA